MRFFIDTEFIEAGPYEPIQLISVGISAENGAEFYAISSEFDPDYANQWVLENVIGKLEAPDLVPRQRLNVIANKVESFIQHNLGDGPQEFWGYYCAYDWVVFCQSFWHKLLGFPSGWPKHCNDIKQLADGFSNLELSPKPRDAHNALADARWNKQAWEFLDKLKQSGGRGARPRRRGL